MPPARFRGRLRAAFDVLATRRVERVDACARGSPAPCVPWKPIRALFIEN